MKNENLADIYTTTRQELNSEEQNEILEFLTEGL